MSLRSFASTFDYHILHWLFVFHGYCCIFMSFFWTISFKQGKNKNKRQLTVQLLRPSSLMSSVSFCVTTAAAPAPWLYGRPSTSWIVSQQDRASNWQQIIPKGEFVITSHNEILLQRGLVWEAPAFQKPVNEMPQNALKYILFVTSLTA